jgi:hypothetical protein
MIGPARRQYLRLLELEQPGVWGGAAGPAAAAARELGSAERYGALPLATRIRILALNVQVPPPPPPLAAVASAGFTPVPSPVGKR